MSPGAQTLTHTHTEHLNCFSTQTGLRNVYNPPPPHHHHHNPPSNWSTGTGSEAVAQMHDKGGCWVARQQQGWAEPSEAEAPGCPRNWWGRTLTGRGSCPRTSCRRSDWSKWWCRPPWSQAHPRSPARSRRVRDNTADPTELSDRQNESSLKTS